MLKPVGSIALLGLGKPLREQPLVRCVRPDPEPDNLFTGANAKCAITTRDAHRKDRLGRMDPFEP